MVISVDKYAYKAIWKYINIIILWEIGNYGKRNKNEENDKIGWILILVMKKQKTGGFLWFTDIWLFLARNCLRRALLLFVLL